MAIVKEYRDEVSEFLGEFPDAGRIKKLSLGLFAIAGVYLERAYLREAAAYPLVDSPVSGLSALAVNEDREALEAELKEIIGEPESAS